MENPLSSTRRPASARIRFARTIAGALAATVLAAVGASCAEPNENHIVLGDDFDDAAPAPAFTDPDASEGAAPLISYCPSNQCPAGHVTCENSYFPCDIDLKTDLRNCGACGMACPDATQSETFDCVEGRCVMTCNIDPPVSDCDGIPDNGCETTTTTNQNCGACGTTCLDPAKPCVERNYGDFGCGCPDGIMLCPADATNPTPHCVKKDDDHNCGACGNECDPEGNGADHPDNTYFGCEAGQCGNLKCTDGFANCDGEFENGCEASMSSNDNCGGCGKACDPGQKCSLGYDGRAFCACPDGQTFCGSCPTICTDAGCIELFCIGACHDLTSDLQTCGSCEVSCDEGNPYSNPVCEFGSCRQRCPEGRADCNGNTSDGCEVDTVTDPGNCGGCGIKCDAIAGQACVGGRCLVAPCDQVDAGPTR